MKKGLAHIWRYIKWPLLISIGCLLFYILFVPFAEWLFVDKTLEVYNATAEKFSSGEECPISYQGAITDTIVRPSVSRKGKIDTLVHRQTISLEPKCSPSDKRTKIEDFGAFSDGAGLLNAFFSFLAFVAVLLTIYLQSKKDEHDKLNGARVQFEQEFFAMVGMLENIVSHLRITEQNDDHSTYVDEKKIEQAYKGTGFENDNEKNPQSTNNSIVVEGREVFKYIYKDRKDKNLYSFVNVMADLWMSSDAQDMCFDGTLDHYFRYLYRILKHIDESELLNRLDNPKKEREYYAHVLRAQLSNYELLMLFYNGLLGEHVNTIKKLIERYAMFNNLRSWELGAYQSEYYQRIQNNELYEDPASYDPANFYSVTAFLDEKELKEIKKAKTKSEKKRVINWIRAKLKACNLVEEKESKPISENESESKPEEEIPAIPEKTVDDNKPCQNKKNGPTLRKANNKKSSGKKGGSKKHKKRKHK